VRDVFPEVETLNVGLNARFAQFAAWNGEVTVVLAPAGELSVLEIVIGLQLEESRMKLDRSM
jgi:hypothetical protein